MAQGRKNSQGTLQQEWQVMAKQNIQIYLQ